MKDATTALINLLAGNQQLYIADLITITTLQSGIIYLTSADIDIIWGGNTFSSGSIPFTRDKIKNTIGVSVDELEVVFYGNNNIHGQPFLQACLAGVFDGATFELDRAFMSTYGQVVGTLIQFVGVIGQLDVSRTEAKFKVMSNLYLLNTMMPKNVYQPSCINTLYDGNCKVPRIAITGNVTSSASPLSLSIAGTAAGEVAGYFNLGYLTFTSGANANLTRTINVSNGGTITLLNPFPNPIGTDNFSAFVGCNKQMSNCQSQQVTANMTCSFATNIMTVQTGSIAGTLAIGQTIVAAGVAGGTTITGIAPPGSLNYNYTLSTTPGTLSTRATTAFNNIIRFRGYPFIPPPDVLT